MGASSFNFENPNGGVAAPSSTSAAFSLVDALASFVVATNGDLTVGMDFCTGASGKTCTGARFYFPEAGSRTVKVCLWNTDGTLIASKSGSVSGAGAKTITFDAAQALAAGRKYRISIYETSGTKYYEVTSTENFVLYYAAISHRAYVSGTTIYGKNSFWVAGDAHPTNDSGTYPVEPVVA
jgi:hypothetical protein